MKQKNILPTQEYLLSILEYRDSTLYWKANKIKNCKEAGCLHSNGYIVITIDKVRYYSHNIIWKMVYNIDIPNDLYIDHINHNKADNNLENLRIVNSIDNSKNRSPRKNTKTGYSNITLKKDKYQVQFGVPRYSKICSSLEEAIQHRNEKYVEFNFHPNNGL